MNKPKSLKILSVVMVLGILLASCSPFNTEQTANTEYILTTAIHNGKFVYMGVNGTINGVVNPALRVQTGEAVTVMLVNSGEGNHNIVFSDLNVHSDTISRKGETTAITFIAPDEDLALEYHDSAYQKWGMQGLLLVGNVVDPSLSVAMEDSIAAAEDAAAENTTSSPPVTSDTEIADTGSEDELVDAAAAQSGEVVEYTLETGLADGKMVFFGKGGEIDGQTNPDLTANPGDTVIITLISGDGALHDIFFEEFDALSEEVVGLGSQTELTFTPDKDGTFPYFCTIPGHRQAGMEGKFIVGSGEAQAQAAESDPSAASEENAVPVTAAPAAENAVDIIRNPTDLPGPIGPRGPENIRVDLETIELTGMLADGTTYQYWTFNGKVPGPFIRIRAGDTVEVHLKNAADSTMPHSVDFHAVTGPGGGAVATQTLPDGETSFTFKALNPGLYVYHCATPMVAHHISNGMYGLILVEPEGGLPEVDHEFYVMQGELYTAQAFGSEGHLTEDIDKMLDEDPEYFTFNGASLALAGDDNALRANTGETVRIFFGVGGPNFTSSFHVIGEIFDRVYDQASLTSDPLTDVQTTLVPPGGATMVEFGLDVPGRYILVDHALSRLERGLAGYLYVEGEDVPEIFDGETTPGSGH